VTVSGQRPENRRSALTSTPPSQEGRPPANGGSPRQTPCLPCDPNRNRWQPVATVSRYVKPFAGPRLAERCHRLRPVCSMAVPSQSGQNACFGSVQRPQMEVDGQRAVRDEVARCRRARSRAPHCGREVKPPRRLAGHLHAPAMTSTLPPDFGWSPGRGLRRWRQWD